MADLFTLVGTIALNYTDAETTIDRLLTKTKLLQERLGGTGGSSSSGSSGTSSQQTAYTGSAGTSGAGSAGVSVPIVTGGYSIKNHVISQLITDGVKWFGNLAKDAVKTGLDWSEDFETNVMTIQTMTGMAKDEATAYYREMLKLDEETPLNADSIFAGVKGLYINGGFQTDQILPWLRVLGDASLGNNATFETVVDAVAKAYSGGKADAKDINRIADAEIPIIELLGEVLGLSGTTQENSALVRQMVEQGKVSGQNLLDAFALFTSPGNKAYNAMANAMQTQAGIASQTEALAAKAAGRLVQEANIDDLKKNVTQKIGDILEQFINWLDTDTDKTLGGKFLDTLGDGAVSIVNQIGRKIGKALTIDDPEYNPTNEREAQLAFLSTGVQGYVEPYMNKTEEDTDSRPKWIKDFLNTFLIDDIGNEVYGPPTPEGWTPGNSISKLETVLTRMEEVLNPETFKTAAKEGSAEGVANGLSGVTITTGSVTLNDGALVGRILPRINLGLGQMAARDLRG